MGTCQLYRLLDGHGGVEQQLREGAESMGCQKRLLQGRRGQE